eukprot:TRINITY_DN38348_c0_g1_i1.p1 TRINITY_DN38348_c0_g1~~TRINITY_DN38348_c0_g1_i1.p1  ORF type:complete len:334 (-),score=54.37 TRINITY_DN38348_c0_g1_i1:30-1031(-)
MSIEEVEDLDYSKDPAWADITPIPQNDGPKPLCPIRYPPGFEEAHDYFRAIQAKGEYSQRALKLTGDVIEHNSANYTAWYYRRRCLEELGTDLNEEVEFTDKWSRDCPKNYQVWYHRRWLIGALAEQVRASKPAEEAERTVKELARKELECHLDCMQVNDDYKNYNGWSHRQFIVSKFDMWDGELDFVEDLLRDDIRNNSAWNHRFTVVRHEATPMTEAVRQREVNFTIGAIRKCVQNESAWNYLGAFYGNGEGQAPWSSATAVEALSREVCSATPADRGHLCRFAVEVLARVHEARDEIEDAVAQYLILKDIDWIRSDFWTWRIALIQRKNV